MSSKTKNTGRKMLFIVRCGLTGESDQIVTCQQCSQKMPGAGPLVSVYHDCDDDVPCDFCGDAG
jgi:hypothetical protein